MAPSSTTWWRGLSDLPAGWTDEQEAGRYRLRRRNDEALFGYVVGPQSWKKYLHPAEVRLLAAERNGQTFRILNNEPAPPRRAFLGVRACEASRHGRAGSRLAGRSLSGPHLCQHAAREFLSWR